MQDNIIRPYTKDDVEILRGTIKVDHSWSRKSAAKLRELLSDDGFVAALGAITGNQAVQQIQAGLKAIYASGWQVAADNNQSFETYPDQSLYPVDSMPALVKRISKALMRADQIQHQSQNGEIDYLAPVIADAEAGFGGPLNAYELVRSLIEAGAAAIHLEDQLSSAKKCGHLGGKVLTSTEESIRKLVAARLAADVSDVPLVIIARTDANNARLIRDNLDCDKEFIDHKQDRTVEGYYHYKGGLDAAIHRALSFAPYADLLWCETHTPSIAEARVFANAIHAEFPGKWLAYNCSPSFNWEQHYKDPERLKEFQVELGEMGYKFQFITLAGFHALNHSMYDLSYRYKTDGMHAYNDLQQAERKSVEDGYQALKHQQFVGVSYFDKVAEIITGQDVSTRAFDGSTEESQF